MPPFDSGLRGNIAVFLDRTNKRIAGIIEPRICCKPKVTPPKPLLGLFIGNLGKQVFRSEDCRQQSLDSVNLSYRSGQA